MAFEPLPEQSLLPSTEPAQAFARAPRPPQSRSTTDGAMQQSGPIASGSRYLTPVRRNRHDPHQPFRRDLRPAPAPPAALVNVFDMFTQVRLHHFLPQLIFVDIAMPRLDGL